MTAQTLGSLMLSSTDPERLRAWYSAALPPKSEATEGGYPIFDYGGFYLFFDRRDDVGDHNPEPGRVVLNFDVDDAAASAERIDRAGASWLSPLEDRDGSYFGTAIDPDGNYIQIIQLSAAQRANMAASSARA